METPSIDILIQRYIDGDMNVAEKASFENRMSSDETIKNAFEDYRLVKGAVKTYAISNIKIELQNAHNSVIKAKSFKNYKPSINGGGFSIINFLIKIIAIGGIVSAVLIYIGKMPLEHEIIQKVSEKMHSYDSLFVVKQDTVWTTIKSTSVAKGDTILIRNQAELDLWKKTHPKGTTVEYKIEKTPKVPSEKNVGESVEENWD